VIDLKLKINWRIPSVVAIVLVGASALGLFSVWQDRLSDFLLTKQKTNQDEVLIVKIDEPSLQAIGQWPWPRVVFAQAINQLQAARSIGVDVNFREPSRLGLADDQAFARSIQVSQVPVVLSVSLDQQGQVEQPIRSLVESAHLGFTNLVVAPDGVVRRIRLQTPELNGFSYALILAQGDTPTIPENYTNEPGRINYRQEEASFSGVSFVDLIRGNLPESFVKDRIIFIGATAEDLQDFHQTPFGLVSGVSIQAQVYQMIKLADFLKPIPQSVNLGLIAVFAFLISILIFKLKTNLHRFGSVLIIFAIYNLAGLFIFDSGFVADLFYPNLSIIFSTIGTFSARYVETSRQKKFLTESFSRYVAPQVVDEIIRDPSRLKLGGQNREITILFSDIRSFTTLSEGMKPEELVTFLNRYLTAMTETVLDHHGVIDKYIGDAIMAFWGAPLEDENHADHGVVTALKMIESLEEFNQKSKNEGFQPINIGIGLNSGEVTVGNLGSEKRFDYTVIGDAVNIASRLEGLNKYYGTQIIISQSTLEKLKSDAATMKELEDNIVQAFALSYHGQQKKILVREIDTVRVKGKQRGLKIYEVVLDKNKSDIESVARSFAQGLQAYYAGNWDQAKMAFNSVLAKLPDDQPTKLLLERCQQLRNIKGWDGIYTLKLK